MRALFMAGVIALAAHSALAVELTPNPQAPPADDTTPAEREQQRLARFSLLPLDQLAAAKRSIRRVSYGEIFDAPSTPAVTFERLADGAVEMTVISEFGRRIDRAKLKPEAWAYITDKDAFALPRPRPAKADAEICHGSTAVIEATENGRTTRYDAAMCNGQADLPAIFYARRLAGLAFDAIPRCAPFSEHAREESWLLVECLKRTNRPATRAELAGNDKNIPRQATNFVIETSTESRGAITSASARTAD